MENTYKGIVPLTTEASISKTSWGDKHEWLSKRQSLQTWSLDSKRT
jgi:hypothetical protein